MDKQKYKNAKVNLIGGRATLLVDGQPIAPMAYSTHSGTRIDSVSNAKRLTEAGFCVFFLEIDSGWKDKSTWDTFNREARYILEANSDAMIICRTICAPTAQWVKDNPDELVVFEDGARDHFTGGRDNYGYDFKRVCLASEKYAGVASKHVSEMVAHLDQSVVGKNIIGYLLLGTPGEWLYRSNFDGDAHCMGFSPSFKLFYSKWLCRKYGSVTNLRRAWNDSQASYEEPAIPGKHEQIFSMPLIPWQTHPVGREYLDPYPASGFPHYQRLDIKADVGHFIDPSKRQSLLDFYEARSAGTAVSIETIAASIKDASCHDVIVGAFFGTVGCCWYHGGGNVGPEFLKESKHVDFLSAPTAYIERIPGGAASFRAPVDGLSFRGKLWFNESDFRTYLNPSQHDLICHGQVFTEQQTIDVFKREFAQVLCDDVNSWWFDTEKNLDSKYLLDVLQKQQREYQNQYRCDNTSPKSNEIVFVYDQSSIWFSDPETNRDLLFFNRIFEIPRVGAPSDHIFLSDIELYDLSSYKLVVFVNCFSVDAKCRDSITKCFKHSDKVLLWCYASGIIDSGRYPVVDALNIKQLTGFDTGLELGGRDGAFRVRKDNQHFSDLSVYKDYGRYSRPMRNGFCWKEGFSTQFSPSNCDPLVYATDRDIEVLGRYNTNQLPALAVKQFDDWTSVFHGPKVLNAEVLRCLAKMSGAHVFTDSDDVLHANNQYISIHASHEGVKTLNLPRQVSAILEIYSGASYDVPESGRVDVSMSKGQTMTFKFVQKETLQ